MGNIRDQINAAGGGEPPAYILLPTKLRVAYNHLVEAVGTKNKRLLALGVCGAPTWAEFTEGLKTGRLPAHFPVEEVETGIYKKLRHLQDGKSIEAFRKRDRYNTTAGRSTGGYPQSEEELATALVSILYTNLQPALQRTALYPNEALLPAERNKLDLLRSLLAHYPDIEPDAEGGSK